MKQFDLRNIKYEVRSEEDRKYIRGIIPYNSKSEDMGFVEIISSSAFNKTLADGADVKALFNHNQAQVLGSTRSGTLKLENTNDGLICDCLLPNTSYANDLFEIVQRGDVQTMSFGFIPVKYEDVGKIRTLKEVKLFEVSYGVTFPAYKETKAVAQKRSLSEITEELKTIEVKEEEKEGVVNALKEIIEKLKPIEKKAEEKEVIVDTSAIDSLSLEMEMALQL